MLPVEIILTSQNIKSMTPSRRLDLSSIRCTTYFNLKVSILLQLQDSSPGMNENDARLLARKLFEFLCQKSGKFQFVLTEVPALKQTNGYDCGIHVLCNAEHATRLVLLNCSIEKHDWSLFWNNIMFFSSVLFGLFGYKSRYFNHIWYTLQ